jgi:hypothetical protein
MKNEILISMPLEEFEAIQKNWIKDVLVELKQNEIKTDLPELLTRRQTADFFGITLVTLWKWNKLGKIKCHSICGHPRYKRDEVLHLVKEVKKLK